MKRLRTWTLVVGVLMVVGGRAQAGDDGFSDTQRRAILGLAVPAGKARPAASAAPLARFGQALFFDKRLSGNGHFSCASCHQPDRAFSDGRPLAKATGLGTRNTPTLINAAGNPWYLWDGAADSLWSQVILVLENPPELGNDRLHLAHTLYRNPDLRRGYQARFGRLPSLADRRRFPEHGSPAAAPGSTALRAWRNMAEADRDAVNAVAANLGRALQAYERRLVVYDSPFDRFATTLAHNANPPDGPDFPAAARRGLKLFVGKARCTLCHGGPELTDQAFHNVGLPVRDGRLDSGREAGQQRLLDSPFNALGRYAVAPGSQAVQRLRFVPPKEQMRGAFKTPSLRNVARTAPYFHDGRAATLAEAVRFYGRLPPPGHLIGKREATLTLVPDLSDAEIADLVAFLKTLNSAPLPDTLKAPPVASRQP